MRFTYDFKDVNLLLDDVQFRSPRFFDKMVDIFAFLSGELQSESSTVQMHLQLQS